MSADNVNHPAHYETGCGFECIDVIVETQGVDAVCGFCLCNAMKYLYRHGRKNGDEDIAKAIWYLNKYLDLKEAEVERQPAFVIPALGWYSQVDDAVHELGEDCPQSLIDVRDDMAKMWETD